MDMSQSEAPAGTDTSDASDSDTEPTVEMPSRQTQSTGDTAAGSCQSLDKCHV